MTTETISAKQAVSIVALSFVSIIVVSGVGGTTEQDNWISILLAMAGAVPLLLMYARLLKLYPGWDLYGICTELLGRTAGKLPVLIFALYAFYAGATAVRTFTEFIIITALPNTPKLLLIAFMTMLAVWMIRSGMQTFGRWSLIAVTVVVVVLFSATMLSIGNMRIENLQPMFSHSFGEIGKSAVTILIFPMGLGVLTLPIFNCLKPNEKRGKIYLLGTLLLGGGLVLMAFFRNLTVLGVPMLSSLNFPTYTSLRLISIGTFLTRLDALISVNFMLAVFVHICVCLLAAEKGLAVLIGTKQDRSLALPCGLLMGAFSEAFFNDFSQLMDWLWAYHFFLIPLELLPLLLLLVAEIKRIIRKKKSGAANKPKENGGEAAPARG